MKTQHVSWRNLGGGNHHTDTNHRIVWAPYVVVTTIDYLSNRQYPCPPFAKTRRLL